MRASSDAPGPKTSNPRYGTSLVDWDRGVLRTCAPNKAPFRKPQCAFEHRNNGVGDNVAIDQLWDCVETR